MTENVTTADRSTTMTTSATPFKSIASTATSAKTPSMFLKTVEVKIVVHPPTILGGSIVVSVYRSSVRIPICASAGLYVPVIYPE